MNEVITDSPADGQFPFDERWPWFVSRMLTDEWFFGLRLSDGTLLGCTHLNNVRQLNGETWLDVELMSKEYHDSFRRHDVALAPTSRTTASINAKHVMYIVELADT